ncbi:MAG: nucleotidyltransferase domain-containing protein [Candidatus Woesearchaeota archaeon]
MNNKIKNIIDSFLKDWIVKDEVEVIFICGSYVIGNPTSYSDIDIYIVTNDSQKIRERGNKIIDGVLIEYFVNPPLQVENYMQDEFNSNTQITAHMIVTGEIYYQKNSLLVENLKNKAHEYLNTNFKELSKTYIEVLKYGLWDGFDNLQEAFKRGEKTFEMSFNTFVYSNLYVTYSKSLRLPVISSERVERYLTQKSYRNKYRVKEFTDTYFKDEFLKLFELNTYSQKMDTLKELVQYVIEQMEGLELNGFKIESELDLK